jgi:hypothetical protein
MAGPVRLLSAAELAECHDTVIVGLGETRNWILVGFIAADALLALKIT